MTLAANAVPSLDPTVLTDGEPAIGVSLFSGRNEASDDCLLTAGVRCDGDAGTRDDPETITLLFDGGVEGTPSL